MQNTYIPCLEVRLGDLHEYMYGADRGKPWFVSAGTYAGRADARVDGYVHGVDVHANVVGDLRGLYYAFGREWFAYAEESEIGLSCRVTVHKKAFGCAVDGNPIEKDMSNVTFDVGILVRPRFSWDLRSLMEATVALLGDSIGDSTLVVAVEYTPDCGTCVQAGWRWMHVRIEGDDADMAFQVSGPTVGLRFVF